MTESLSHRRVLAVDDNPDSAAMLAQTLRNLGHAVVVAHDGRAALKLAEAFRPEIVFLDLQMPNPDGFDVLRGLRKLERMTTSRMIVIALSAHGDAAYREATSEEGFDGHLQKPLDLAELASLAPSLLAEPGPVYGG